MNLKHRTSCNFNWRSRDECDTERALILPVAQLSVDREKSVLALCAASEEHFRLLLLSRIKISHPALGLTIPHVRGRYLNSAAKSSVQFNPQSGCRSSIFSKNASNELSIS